MRPINKFTVGHILANGEMIDALYIPYQNAKQHLIENLGDYCCYCERKIVEGLAVEHIKPKSNPRYSNLEFSWKNFLLACLRCNGNDNKGNKLLNLQETFFPTRDETFRIFVYEPNGYVSISPNLSRTDFLMAWKLYDALGLGKFPGLHPNHLPKDNRWKKRNEVWNLASLYKTKFENGMADHQTIIDLALSNGCWSVWMTVFDEYVEIKNCLCRAFQGTRFEV